MRLRKLVSCASPPEQEIMSSCRSQNALVSAVAAANPRTVVVMSVPGAVLTPWRAEVA